MIGSGTDADAPVVNQPPSAKSLVLDIVKPVIRDPIQPKNSAPPVPLTVRVTTSLELSKTVISNSANLSGSINIPNPLTEEIDHVSVSKGPARFEAVTSPV